MRLWFAATSAKQSQHLSVCALWSCVKQRWSPQEHPLTGSDVKTVCDSCLQKRSVHCLNRESSGPSHNWAQEAMRTPGPNLLLSPLSPEKLQIPPCLLCAFSRVIKKGHLPHPAPPSSFRSNKVLPFSLAHPCAFSPHPPNMYLEPFSPPPNPQITLSPSSTSISPETWSWLLQIHVPSAFSGGYFPSQFSVKFRVRKAPTHCLLPVVSCKEKCLDSRLSRQLDAVLVYGPIRKSMALAISPASPLNLDISICLPLFWRLCWPGWPLSSMVYWLTHPSDWLPRFYFHIVCLLVTWGFAGGPEPLQIYDCTTLCCNYNVFIKCSIILSVSNHPPCQNSPSLDSTTSYFHQCLPEFIYPSQASWGLAAHSFNYPLAKS